jgi:hypothetical protein
MNINKTKLIENFKDIKNAINLNILICYRNLFTKEGIISNLGNFILMAFFIFHIINIIIFYMKQYKEIKEKIELIKYGLKFSSIKRIDKIRKSVELKTVENVNDNDGSKNIINQVIKKKKKKKKKRRNTVNKNIILKNDMDIKNNEKLENIIPEIGDGKNKINIEQKKENKVEMIKDIMKFCDDEINDLNYELALEYDKRTFCDFYISLLKSKHNFIFSFINKNDYNSRLIKIDLFFISFSIFYTINALFFNDDTMHNIYKNKGSFGLEYQIPIIIYSSLISMILNIPLKLLSLSNDAIIKFKQNKEKEDIDNREKSLKTKLKIKFIIYFIISSIFLLFFWYYISMFGAIYKNTQNHLLKDTLISFILSMIYPFGIYLLPCFLRIPALSDTNKKRKYLYDFSKLVQMI